MIRNIDIRFALCVNYVYNSNKLKEVLLSMYGDRLKELREAKGLTLEDLGKLVNKSGASISRYENVKGKSDYLKLVEMIAHELNTSPAYLMGFTNYSGFLDSADTLEVMQVIDNDMSPIIPKNSFVQYRRLNHDEELVTNDYYYINFDDKKVFRKVIRDNEGGLGFLPRDTNESRIAYDLSYVTIIGKPITGTFSFKDI